jgi:hypothetical protein
MESFVRREGGRERKIEGGRVRKAIRWIEG